MSFFSKIQQKIFSERSNFLLNFVVCVVALRLFNKAFQGWQKINFENLLLPQLWQALLAVVFIHVGIFMLAWGYSRLTSIFSTALIFLGILLSSYFVVLINCLTLGVSETIVLRGFFFAWGILFWLMWVKLPHSRRSNQSLSWGLLIIILLWASNSLSYCLEYNLDPGRQPYGDEYGLWYESARRMIDENILKAHLRGYAGGGVHPFGVPFIAALPSQLVGMSNAHTIFFMPFAVILVLSVILCRMLRLPWALLFFIIAVFVTFNNRSWMADLLYRLVFGEGLSSVIFLVLTYEFVQWHGLKEIKPFQFLLMSFSIGLVALTKFPLSMMGPVFLITFSVIVYAKLISPKKWFTILAGGFLAVLPFMTWRLFVGKFQLADDIVRIFHGDYFSRIGAPNEDMLTRIYQDNIGQYPHSIYFLLLAFIFLWWAIKKRGTIHFLPIGTLMAALFIYYAYIYSYGAAGEGDHGSAVRYAMPLILPVYYLGALGFQAVMEKLEQWPRQIFLRGLIQFVLATLVISKLF